MVVVGERGGKPVGDECTVYTFLVIQRYVLLRPFQKMSTLVPMGISFATVST